MYLTNGFGQFRMLTRDDITHRRNAPLASASTSILSPRYANPLEQGEWLEQVGTTKEEYQRATDTDTPGALVAFPVASKRGQSDCQAIGAAEVYTAAQGALAETTSYNTAGTYAVGTQLMVALITQTIDGVSRAVSCLTPATVDEDNVHAEVLVPPTDKTSFSPMKIRIVRMEGGVTI